MLKRFYLVFQCVKLYFSIISSWQYVELDEYTPRFSVWFANKYRTHPLKLAFGSQGYY